MEIVGLVLNIISRLWTCSAHKTDYVCKLKQNLNTLETSYDSLRCKRDDVNARIAMAESNSTEPAKRTNVIIDWLQQVQALETKVQKILDDNQAIRNDQGSSICCWGREKCWSAYKLGKSVVENMNAVKSMLEGDFQNVTYRCQPDPLQQIPSVEVVGMEAEFNEILESVVTERNDVRIVGLYGMGGVGKTTLLHKVNNEFAERKQFDVIIFIVVSKDLNLKSIQNRIGKKLGVSWTEQTEMYERANDIFKVLKNRKFLLLLDDIWEGFDLEAIGVSKNTIQENGSKVVLTTRDMKVCGFMEADKKIKIECLDEDQAWILFQQKVKQEALSCHPDVVEVAKKVAKECRGLPLALIAIGRTMSSKTDLQLWKYALHTLKESASQFSGMADKVLAILKFSYDNLENQKLKSCFLHCLLYPEDFSFEKNEIIALWTGEGFLDNIDDLVLAENEGHDVVRCLKDACLLETGIQLGVKMEDLVKMHDVVRDLATWIASDLGRGKNSYLTLQMKSTLKLHEWEKVERISLIQNQAIKELNGVPDCSNLLTLVLKKSSISHISDDFFRFMPMLKVLNMNGVELKNLPTSIFSRPELQYLDMPGYGEGVVLTPGSLASLTKLKILGLSKSCCHWEVEGGPRLCELESLQHLIGLKITIGTGLALQRLVTSRKLQSCTKYLNIKYCPGITSLSFLPSVPSSTVSSSRSLVDMSCLIYLSMISCDDLEELGIMSQDGVTSFTTLEYLFLFSMPKLRIVWDVPQQAIGSVSLTRVIIKGCHRFKEITWLVYAQNLEVLELEDMNALEEIISDGFATKERFTNAFPRLNLLALFSLGNLKRICECGVKFFLLEKISVKGCPKLKKLPFRNNSVIPRTLKMVQGEKQWWESLEWEDEATISNLAPYFRET